METMDARPRRRRRSRVFVLTLGLFTGPPAMLIALTVVAAGVGTCAGAGGTSDTPSSDASAQIPSDWLRIFQQVGAHYLIPWEVLAGIGKNECDFGRDPDPSCTPQPGATGIGATNPAGASGPMQIGTGGSAGTVYQELRQYLPDPALGPHDPTTAVELAALVLIKLKGAPQGAPIDAYPPFVAAYNGSGPAAQAYAQRVISDANEYQGSGAVAVSAGCQTVPGQYASPLANAPHVIAERVDMGVDYGDPDPEPIDAIGAATITYAGPQGGGWQPNCVNYTLAQPPTSTERYVYICEGMRPTVHNRQRVEPGQQIATFIPGGGIEIGFAAAPGSPISTRAAALSQQAKVGDPGQNRTYCGQQMSNLIQQAGGPPGLADGRPVVGTSC